jgi:hypothetical protein
MKLPFKIKQVKPRIFLFEFTDQYDMCMHFLRYQEFYESPNPKFRNKSFTILEFMEWQAKKEGDGNFTYPTEWSGFNFPSNKLIECQQDLGDPNKYDEVMSVAYDKCCYLINGYKWKNSGYNEEVEAGKFYIIGCLKGNAKTLDHEISHGMFCLNSEYKKEATKLVKALPVKIRTSMEKMLAKGGYTKQVFIDEINAYLSTDSKEDLALRGIKINKQDQPFKELFKKFNV